MVGRVVDSNGLARHYGRGGTQRHRCRRRCVENPTDHHSEDRRMTGRTPEAIARARDLIGPALHAAVDRLEDEHMRRVASYQLGWLDAEGRAVEGGGGKAIRPTLAMLSAGAGAGPPRE